MPSAVDVSFYCIIITLNENLSHVPTNNYLIRAYDVDNDNNQQDIIKK